MEGVQKYANYNYSLDFVVTVVIFFNKKRTQPTQPLVFNFSFIDNLALKDSNDKDYLPISFVCLKLSIVKSKKILLLLIIGYLFSSQEWELTNQMSGLSYIILCQNQSKDITKNLEELDVTVDIPLVSFSMPMQTSKLHTKFQQT